MIPQTNIVYYWIRHQHSIFRIFINTKLYLQFLNRTKLYNCIGFTCIYFYTKAYFSNKQQLLLMPNIIKPEHHNVFTEKSSVHMNKTINNRSYSVNFKYYQNTTKNTNLIQNICLKANSSLKERKYNFSVSKNNNRYIKTSRVTINISKTKYINSTISKNNISNNPISYLNNTIIKRYLPFNYTYNQKISNNYRFIVARIGIILCILFIFLCLYTLYYENNYFQFTNKNNDSQLYVRLDAVDRKSTSDDKDLQTGNTLHFPLNKYHNFDLLHLLQNENVINQQH